MLLLWRSRALRGMLDTGQLAAPPPAGLNPGKVKRFPILGEAIYRAVAQDERRRMLERLIPTMRIRLRCLTGCPHSNLLKGLLSPGSITGAFERHRCQRCDRARFHQHHSLRYCIHGKVFADVNLLAGVLKRGKRFFENRFSARRGGLSAREGCWESLDDVSACSYLTWLICRFKP